MRKLLLDLGLFQPLSEQIQQGLPVFGTCAGLILLAKDSGRRQAAVSARWILQSNAMPTGGSWAAFTREAVCQRYRHGPHDLYPGAVHSPRFLRMPRCWRRWTERSWPPVRKISWSRPFIRNCAVICPSIGIFWTWSRATWGKLCDFKVLRAGNSFPYGFAVCKKKARLSIRLEPTAHL